MALRARNCRWSGLPDFGLLKRRGARLANRHSRAGATEVIGGLPHGCEPLALANPARARSPSPGSSPEQISIAFNVKSRLHFAGPR